MSKYDEVEAALAAFNKVRAEVGGIKTEDQQRYAMNEALDAADRVRNGGAPDEFWTRGQRS